MNTVAIPEIYCPFDFAVNPLIDALHERSMQWVCDMGLALKGSEKYDRVALWRGEALAAYAQPFDGLEDLRLNGEFIIWLLIHDDYVDEAYQEYDSGRLARLSEQLLAVLGGQPLESPEPLARAFQDICKRVAARPKGGTWLKRLARITEHYLQANIWERSLKDAGTVPDLATFLKMRMYGSMVDMALILIAVSANIAADAAFLDHTHIKVLTETANRHTCYTNDVSSFEKESRVHARLNLVTILGEEFGLSRQEAINRVVDMANRETFGFVRLKGLLPSFGSEDEQARRYVAILEHWMRGHLEWVKQTRRYNDL